MSKQADIISDVEIRARETLPLDSKKVRELESESRDEQRMLSLNAWHLARYLIEHEKVPRGLDIGQFLVMAEHYPDLHVDRKVAFVNQYTQLEAAADKVTARTLYATRIHGKSFFDAMFSTSVGQYLLVLTLITGVLAVMLLISRESIHQAMRTDFGFDIKDWPWLSFATFKDISPFYAAGLGACVYLLRVTKDGLRDRTFDPARIPSHLIRLGLGTLAGGTIVFFPELFGGTTSAASLGVGVTAFIFGYAVDVYYKVLDRIGGEISTASGAKQGAETVAKGAKA